MAGLSDFIFGSSPSATTTNAPLMTPQQQAALSQVISQLVSGPTTPTQAFTPYGGQFTAPLTSGQNLSLSALEQQSMNAVDANRTASDAVDKLIKGGGSPVDIQDYFTKSVETPMLFDFQNKILPMLQSSFAGSSAFGSDKLKQQELLTNDLTRNLTSSRADLAYRSSTDAANRLLTAAGLAPQIGASTVSTLTQNLGAQAVPQQTQQAQLTAQYQDFLRGQTAGQSQVAQLMQALGLQAFQPQTVVTPGSTGLAGGVANTITAMLTKAAINSPGGFFGLGGGAADWMATAAEVIAA